jgi:hypothetical protein
LSLKPLSAGGFDANADTAFELRREGRTIRRESVDSSDSSYQVAGGLAAGNAKLLAEMVWPHFWAVQIILFMLILVYCTARELVRVIGKERMLRLFFGPLPLPAF